MFIYLIFTSLIMLYFLHSTSVLSLYMDVVLKLSNKSNLLTLRFWNVKCSFTKIRKSRTSRLHLVSRIRWSAGKPNVFKWCEMASPSEPITPQVNLYGSFKSPKNVPTVHHMACAHGILCFVSCDYISGSWEWNSLDLFANIPLHATATYNNTRSVCIPLEI